MKVEAEVILRVSETEFAWVIDIFLTACASENLGTQEEAFAHRFLESIGYDFDDEDDDQETTVH